MVKPSSFKIFAIVSSLGTFSPLNNVYKFVLSILTFLAKEEILSLAFIIFSEEIDNCPHVKNRRLSKINGALDGFYIFLLTLCDFITL